ncbi:MAG: ABC transporter ATP-binding protein [Clostridiales bacterium]|nr:ABC transporter ATP-binding protein [Clostridiales bacterium]
MADKKQSKKKTGMARCLELASKHKGLVFISGILATLAAVCSFLPYLSIYFIMRELIGVFPDMVNANMTVILRYGWLALAGIAGNVILYFCALMCSHLAAFGTLYELKLAFANHITEIPLGYHLTIGSGRMRKIMDENIESIEKFIAHQFPDFVASLVAPLVLVILLLAIDWRYGVVSLLGIILAFVVQFLGFNGNAKEKMHHYQVVQEDMNSASVEYIRGMPEIKAFNQTADSFRRLSKSITDYTSFVLEYAMGWQNCMPGFTTIIHSIYLLLIPVGIFIGMGTGDYRSYSLTFIFYLVLVPAISGVLNKIMYISESFTQIDGNVERMEEILSISALPDQDGGTAEQGHNIEFDHVSFSYGTDTSVKALNSVSFMARQGEVTAIVGPSGGGKSTIANLVSRFWDVTEGCIRIGGVDIRKIPQAELMRQVSFVFQDTFLFRQSILDNIRMGNPAASKAQVIEAAKAAQCHDFIEKLPDGYHTMIGAAGIRLSGGERQRIAIARAIIKDAPIIVLDEATAFSDPENEYLIQKAFEKLIKNKTVIMIAHRLSTIRNADQILVMEHGQLIEQGTHDTLMEQQGKYAQMWSSYMESISWKICVGNGGAVK